ncbi:hypothetical protein, partial [Pseudomonas sp. HY2-MNA-CIBAN-0224]|uniref:hypothetical protein n=1 Tax=Pseudomonas sp. HY2-MNA-CIBAN-0224 TaxID=3140471 RepID=UPI00331B55F8
MFIIRPGLIGCYFDKQYDAAIILNAVIKSLKQLQTTQFTIPNFARKSTEQYASIGHISLPLLDNPD